MVNLTVNFTKYQIYNGIWSKYFQNLIEVKQTCFKLQPQMQSEARFKKHTPDCWLSQETTASSSSVFSAERWDSNTFLNFCKIQRKNEENFWGKQNFSINPYFYHQCPNPINTVKLIWWTCFVNLCVYLEVDHSSPLRL